MKKSRKAPLFIILAASCWGIIGIFTRQLALKGLNPVQITATRCFVTAICLLIYNLLIDKTRLRIRLKDSWMFVCTGIFSFVFFNICYFITITKTSLSIASIMLYTAPSFVIILSAIIFKEKITKRKLIALIIAYSGSVFTTGILNNNIQISLLAFLAGLGSGLGYGLYSIFGRFALNKYDSITVTTYTFVFASIGILPFSGLREISVIISSNIDIVITIILLGVVSTLIPFLLYTKGLEGMESGKAAVMAFMEPMVATITGLVVFKEPINKENLTGIILIFISIIVLNIKRKEKKVINTTFS